MTKTHTDKWKEHVVVIWLTRMADINWTFLERSMRIYRPRRKWRNCRDLTYIVHTTSCVSSYWSVTFTYRTLYRVCYIVIVSGFSLVLLFLTACREIASREISFRLFKQSFSAADCPVLLPSLISSKMTFLPSFLLGSRFSFSYN